MVKVLSSTLISQFIYVVNHANNQMFALRSINITQMEFNVNFLCFFLLNFVMFMTV